MLISDTSPDEDTWILRITPPTIDAQVNAVPTIRWERRKSPINRPSPRAGVNMVYRECSSYCVKRTYGASHYTLLESPIEAKVKMKKKTLNNLPATRRWETLTSQRLADKGRGILFGGVHDVEDSEESIDSEFFNALLAWNIERNRFFQLNLRRAQVAPKTQSDGRGTAKRARGEADEVELLRNLASLQTKDLIANTTSEVVRVDTGMPDVPTKLVKPVLNAMPHPRFNAHLAVQDDTLYIFGGTYEHADAEYTFDEM